MLSYDDSKRLKELGYPQELRQGDWYYKTWAPEVPRLYSEPYGDTKYVRVPMTDGMIEGLGKSLISIKILSDGYSLLGIRSGHIQGIISGELKQALCELWKKVKTVPPSE